MRRLVLGGLLASQKGQGGGFRLARPPGEIRFVDILSAVDAYPEPGRCAFGWGACDELTPCPLHESWSQLNDALCNWASTSTLAVVQRSTPPEAQRRD
jgi:Rrf2 family iron-sulfur cluster assembly transcriptional regulator